MKKSRAEKALPKNGPRKRVGSGRLVRRPAWVCEYCFTTSAENKLPAEWDFVWQSAVCPSCKPRVVAAGGYMVVRGGAYAGTKSDPRASSSNIRSQPHAEDNA